MNERLSHRTEARGATAIAIVLNALVVFFSPYVFAVAGIDSRLSQSLLLGGAALVILGPGYLIDRRLSRRDER